MSVSARQKLRRWPVRTALLGLCALAVLIALAAEGITWARWQLFDAQLAALDAPEPSRDRVARLAFAFRGEEVLLEIPYDSASVRRAARFDFAPAFSHRGRWRARYLQQVVETESNTSIMASLAQELRAERSRLDLDSDAYVELMACAIQSIPYGQVGAPLKTPVEVLASGSGVCTEKSILLAALFAHEGYGSGVWSLHGHRHVGAAVRTRGTGFRHSGYAFVETTKPAYVGELPGGLAASGPVFRAPRLAVVSNGRSYDAGAQVDYILWLRSSAQRAATGRADANRVSGPLAAGSTDRLTAEKLVRWIDWNAHDRERVFERLTLVGNGGRDVLLGM